jgi:4-alpha-glucanotransferase
MVAEMAENDALRRLARRVGIGDRFVDALGEPRVVSDETLRAVVEAFGLPGDPTRAEAELDEAENARPFGLEPVAIVHAEDPRPTLRLRSTGLAGRNITWACRLEDGGRRAGAFAAPDAAGAIELPLPPGLPLGYHRLEIEAGGVAAEFGLIVAPPACYLPPELGQGQRRWALTCQLHSLVSAANWGSGDFSDLAALARLAGSEGAAALGINPVHALFAAEPLHVSPYSPSSRTRLNYLYIDPTSVPGFAEDAEVRALMGAEHFGATRWAARSASLIDYGAVAALKRPVLETLYRRFRQQHLDAAGEPATPLGRTFAAFRNAGGAELCAFAQFEALHEHFHDQTGVFSWRDWPAPYRDPHSPAVAEFAAAQQDRIEFFIYLQWEAERQLAAAAVAGRAAGLLLGLYRDLAVGAHPNGAEAWADQALVSVGATIGAPPDALSRAGQNWGLAPVNPLVLRRQGFAPFIAAMRANMRHAGVLRIDHVMSLMRLYWIPSGMEGRSGAYVGYPFDELVRLAALESHRHRCAVIGEDLGTVPEGFRDSACAANLLSYRVLAFERGDDGGFLRPEDYPPLAAAAAATHDMPTIAGFWLGRDIAWRQRLGLYPDRGAYEAELAGRERDRLLLLEALAQQGLLPRQRFGEFLPSANEAHFSPELGEAVLLYLARSRARLTLVQLEDVLGEVEQANLPGTTDGHPNWRRRLSRTLEEIAAGPGLNRLSDRIAAARDDAAPE